MSAGRLWRAVKREPLAQFLVLGLLLFAGHRLVDPDAPDGTNQKVIHVDRDVLVQFIEQRTKLFDEAQARDRWTRLPAAERASLLKELVREEALYREALAWGLEKDDYVIRRRLVQSLEFAVRNGMDAGVQLDEAALRRHYEAHKARFAAPALISFTHNFFSAELHGRGEARRLAKEALASLSKGRNEPLGDRFLYQRNYANSSPDVVISHFGSALSERLFALPADADHWRGPFESAHGFHLVQVTRRDPDRIPSFEEVRDLVVRDANEAQVGKRQQQALDKIVASYRVRVSNDLRRAKP